MYYSTVEPVGDLYISRADGTGQRQLTVTRSSGPAHTDCPDGQRLVGFAGPTSPSSGVFMYTFKTQTYEHLTDFGEWPVWLPDNRRVLMGDGGKQFWLLDTQTKRTKLIYSGGRDVLGPPRLPADGRTAYYSRRVTEADIHLMTLR